MFGSIKMVDRDVLSCFFFLWGTMWMLPSTQRLSIRWVWNCALYYIIPSTISVVIWANVRGTLCIVILADQLFHYSMAQRVFWRYLPAICATEDWVSWPTLKRNRKSSRIKKNDMSSYVNFLDGKGLLTFFPSSPFVYFF